MKFGFNFGLLGKGKGGLSYTNCLMPLIQLTDGWYGFDIGQSPTGVIDPTHTSDLQLVYAFKFDTVSGDWILQFGDAGDELALNAHTGVIQFEIDDADNVLLTWNEANLRYEGNDVGTAEAVVVELGNEVCFASVLVPRVLVWYDFGILHAEEMAVATTTTFNRVMNWIRNY